ncbi:MAG: DUF4900 domain-containing protein, partial [Candidatus Methylomirabilaceae bacterium]
MSRHRSDQRGLALMSALITIFILAIMSGLVLYLAGKEIGLTTMRTVGAQSMYIAEAGAVRARSSLMALMNADPSGVTVVDPSLGGATMQGWYANGVAANQNAFRMFDYLVIDGMRYTLGATSATNSVTFYVNWSLAQPHRKLQVAGPAPANPLGAGTYTGTVVISRRLAPHPTDPLAPQRYIQELVPAEEYEYYYTYNITSDSWVPAASRRRIMFSRDFSLRVRRQNFARYALFTHVHTTPAGGAIWFTSRTSFDGPVHTNGQYRFAFFPKYGTPDSGTPCDPTRIASTLLTSVSTTAWYNNNGSPLQLAANENVVGGVRRDAPVLPDCTPTNYADDNDNPPANFTRGVSAIPIPTNPYLQQGVAIGRDPADTTPVTNLQIRQAVPELADNSNPVPIGIYVPVVDGNSNGISDAGEALAGGIYAQGTLTSLTLSVSGPTNNLAVYTLVGGGQTVTVTVNRTAGTTT